MASVMDAKLKWSSNMAFTGEVRGHSVAMDTLAPIGKGEGLTPKELVAIGLGGCTAMDVAALMKKYRQPVTTFDVDVHVEQSDNGHPVVFRSVVVTFRLTGEIEKDKLLEAVHLSQTRYCGVSAMLSQAAPIEYKVELNGEEIGSGHADFHLKEQA